MDKFFYLIFQYHAPLHQHSYSPYSSLYISQGAGKENLLYNQTYFLLVIILSFLVT